MNLNLYYFMLKVHLRICVCRSSTIIDSSIIVYIIFYQDSIYLPIFSTYADVHGLTRHNERDCPAITCPRCPHMSCQMHGHVTAFITLGPHTSTRGNIRVTSIQSYLQSLQIFSSTMTLLLHIYSSHCTLMYRRLQM